MIMVRELTEEEIKQIAIKHKYVDYGYDGENEVNVECFDELSFARALFEAARIQQTDRSEND